MNSAHSNHWRLRLRRGRSHRPAALLKQASAADYLYLGDTARLPYGSKSQATVARYAVSSARFLVEQGAEALVIACNTASALGARRDCAPRSKCRSSA